MGGVALTDQHHRGGARIGQSAHQNNVAIISMIIILNMIWINQLARKPCVYPYLFLLIESIPGVYHVIQRWQYHECEQG